MSACSGSQFPNIAVRFHSAGATQRPMPAYTQSVFSRVSGPCQPNAYLADKLPVAFVETRIFYRERS